jgi:hypothetical protein
MPPISTFFLYYSLSLSLSFVSFFCFYNFIALAAVDLVLFLTNKAVGSWSRTFQQSAAAADTHVFADCYLAYGLHPRKWTCSMAPFSPHIYKAHYIYSFTLIVSHFVPPSE